MFLRIDRLQVELPMPDEPDPNAASAVQELLGGRFGEMSTLMNYTYQSFNFRGREAARPFYELISNIAAEELGHIELVAHTINAMLTGAVPDEGAPPAAPLSDLAGVRNTHHFLNHGATALVANSMGQPWQGDYVFNSGDLVLDLLHNFFLECGARAGKLRVYEMTDNPSARQMLGYLFVRGGVHAHAYALALEQLTGVEMKKMLPIPNIENVQLPESGKWEELGMHRKLYRFSPDDYKEVAGVWQGTALDGSGPLEVVDGPPQGGDLADLAPNTDAFIPDYHPEEIQEIAMKLYQKAGG
jgi:Mn-containing catalase